MNSKNHQVAKPGFEVASASGELWPLQNLPQLGGASATSGLGFIEIWASEGSGFGLFLNRIICFPQLNEKAADSANGFGQETAPWPTLHSPVHV